MQEEEEAEEGKETDGSDAYRFAEKANEVEFKEYFSAAVPVAVGFMCLSEVPQDLNGKAV